MSSSCSAATVTATNIFPVTLTNLRNYVVAAPSTVGNLSVGCQGLESNLQNTFCGDKFNVYCGKDMASSTIDNNGYEVMDFVAIMAYSFQDCIEACSNANYLAGSTKKCQAVTFWLSMAYATQMYDANYW